jgi:hypothetical protein
MALADTAPNSATSPDLELLEQHKPVLHFDRQYDYRAASVLGMVQNAGNLLRRSDGEVIARVGGDPPLTLDLLSGYPDGAQSEPGDCLCQAPDALGDARAMDASADYAGRLYGRVVPDGERTWLQYWFWLYYNPKNLFGFGKHEGDWEMIQIGLGPDGEPDRLAYAQHDSGEARKPADADWADRERRRHPIVYVAPLSHACYFEPTTHPYLLGIDHPYGDGPADPLPVELVGKWADWPGHWGNTERAIAGLGKGPSSPSQQNPKWNNPASFQLRMGLRRVRALMGRVVHFLGRPFYPREPRLAARLDGRRCIVDYELTNTPLRRSRHLYLTVHHGDRVVASRAVDRAGPSGSTTLRLSSPLPPAPEVWGSTFNRVRQRSNLAKAAQP